MRSKYTCDIASHAYNINDLEKMFLGGYRSISTAKNDFDHINEIPPHRGRELMSYAMSLHPLSMPSMSIVSKFMINNTSEKQQKEHS